MSDLSATNVRIFVPEETSGCTPECIMPIMPVHVPTCMSECTSPPRCRKKVSVCANLCRPKSILACIMRAWQGDRLKSLLRFFFFRLPSLKMQGFVCKCSCVSSRISYLDNICICICAGLRRSVCEREGMRTCKYRAQISSSWMHMRMHPYVLHMPMCTRICIHLRPNVGLAKNLRRHDGLPRLEVGLESEVQPGGPSEILSGWDSHLPTVHDDEWNP